MTSPRLGGFIENGKRPGNSQTPANRFLPSRLLINKQHVSMHFLRKRDRLALARIQLPQDEAALRSEDFHPRRRGDGPVLHRLRRKWMPEFRYHGRRDQNSRVQLAQEPDLPDQDEVVDRRRVSDDDYRAQR